MTSSPTTVRPAPEFAALTGKVLFGFVGTWVFALMAANLVPVLIAAMVQDLGLTIASAGAVATGMTAGSAAAMLVTNRIVAYADRPLFGRIGLVGMVLGYSSAAFFMTTPMVAIGLMVGGIGAGIMIATGTAAASSTKDPDKTVSVVMIINRLGATALLAIAPLFNNDLRSVLLVIAALGVLGLLLAGGLPNLATRVTETTPNLGNAGNGATGSAKASRVTPVRASTITATAIVLAVSMCLWSLTEDMVYSMASVLSDRAGVADDTAGMLLAGKVFGGLIGALMAPVMLRFLGRGTSLVLIIAISTVTKFIMITTTNAALYSTSMLVWGVMYGAVLVLVTGLAAVMDVTGRTGVVVSGAYLAGVAFGPLVGGQLVELITPLQYAFLVTAPSVVFGAALWVISRRRAIAEKNETEQHMPAQDKTEQQH